MRGTTPLAPTSAQPRLYVPPFAAYVHTYARALLAEESPAYEGETLFSRYDIARAMQSSAYARHAVRHAAIIQTPRQNAYAMLQQRAYATFHAAVRRPAVAIVLPVVRHTG